MGYGQMTKPTSCGRPFGEAEGVKLWQCLPPTCSPAVCPVAAQTGSEPIAPPQLVPRPCRIWGQEHAGTTARGLHIASQTAFAWTLCKTNGSCTSFLSKLSTLFNMKINMTFEKQTTLVAVHASVPFKPLQLTSCLTSSKKSTRSG